MQIISTLRLQSGYFDTFYKVNNLMKMNHDYQMNEYNIYAPGFHIRSIALLDVC